MRRLFLLPVAFIFFTHFLFAQNAKYHSEIIFRLTQYIEWSEQQSDYKFIVGVVGNSQDYYDFQAKVLDEKLKKDRTVEVRFYNCTDDIKDCDLIYISHDCDISINQIVRATKGESILIVSDNEGYGEAGALINFVDSAGKLKFELNEQEAEKRGLKVSDELKGLAILI